MHWTRITDSDMCTALEWHEQGLVVCVSASMLLRVQQRMVSSSARTEVQSSFHEF